MNDIALLRLGKTNSYYLLHNPFTEEQVDLSVFSPACLPNNSSSLVGLEGHLYGEQLKPLNHFHPVSISGWGDTGVEDTSTDKLQETVVSIVQSSSCMERMNQTEGVNEDLILCTGGAQSGGPCEVNKTKSLCTVLFQ